MRKKILHIVMAGCMGLSTALLPLSKAEAVDGWGAAAQALGVYAVYKSSLASILALGNDVNAQVQSRAQDIRQNGLDPNPNDVRVVDAVMQQLVLHGDYVLKNNSLPFIWAVNDSKDFNAACYPTNYISVNKALVRGLNLEPDELAAVLAHEMTHGLEQHSASNYAKAVAQYMGMSFLNMDTNSMDWNKLNGLANYSIAKNITLPTEYEADIGGFYIMTSAGFNPGGGAAAMSRMAYYLTYETQNFLEHQSPNAEENEREHYSDHPETKLREERLAQMMSDYGMGHVTVQNQQDICIDGEKLLSVEWTGDAYDNKAENAYYVAGAIAKAFHDYNSITGWNFRKDSTGKVTCLQDIRVNKTLQEFLQLRNAGEKLQQLVIKAYEAEQASGVRQKYRAMEEKRWQELQKLRAANMQADMKTVKKLRENADAYSDYALGDKALEQMQRVFACQNIDDMGESLAINARAMAVKGDYAAALAEANRAVSTNPQNVYIFLNRSDIYHMQGDTTAALADLTKAKEIDKSNIYVYLLSAQIYDELGNKEQAKENYREFYKLRPKAYRNIPEEYLQEIAPKEYKEVTKAKAEAREKYEKEWHKQNKEKQQN